ncbi:MAG: AgmX/PglI C-terminal domain-containing protein [Myxococcales bacterium]|nr:AgmX/PglI C-terminal domain-containing protein [Myxococcales bacterium]
MIHARSLLVALAALGGCSTATPTPDAPVAPPVIELEEPPRAENPTTKEQTEEENEAAKKKALEQAAILGILGPEEGPVDGIIGGEPSDGAFGGPSSESHGVGGLGLVGTGPGGGGTGEGIGLGSVGLIGKGGGSGTGQGYGRGSGRLGRPTSVRLGDGNASVQGSLNKDIIRRIVRRHINQVRYCYERALAKNPALEGKVVAKFVISPTGTVTEATIGTGLDSEVDACILGVMKRMQFPVPDGGGVVKVSYPFVFSTSSDAKGAATPGKG